jgi:hypothetical protein
MDAVVTVLNGQAKIFHNTTRNGNFPALLVTAWQSAPKSA